MRRAGTKRATRLSTRFRSLKEVAMLTMTKAAGDYLTAVLQRANTSHDTAIRILLEDDELAPTLDTARPGDETLDYHGRKVVLLDAEVCEYLADSTLDFQATDDGPRLLILQ